MSKSQLNDVRNRIKELTTTKLLPIIDNVYKESLRSMLNIFGNVYYIDGNGNRIKVNCSHGNPERIAGRLKSDNTLILPMLTVVETKTDTDTERTRYQNLISESHWDSEKLRATRIVSLPPRPINITYEVNIWAKYKADMDMIRSSIFSLFSPDINVGTKFSSHNKAYINGETDAGSVTAADTGDRVLQKSISISLETYIPTPKFAFTNTGQIHEFNFPVEIDEGK
tara:strand:- start:750 stop:1427 length:678 start_codon:yes stop_codon:yes gene_type:complete